MAWTLATTEEVGAQPKFEHQIPIKIPEGINGVQPDIALAYDSRR